MIGAVLILAKPRASEGLPVAEPLISRPITDLQEVNSELVPVLSFVSENVINHEQEPSLRDVVLSPLVQVELEAKYRNKSTDELRVLRASLMERIKNERAVIVARRIEEGSYVIEKGIENGIKLPVLREGMSSGGGGIIRGSDGKLELRHVTIPEEEYPEFAKLEQEYVWLTGKIK